MDLRAILRIAMRTLARNKLRSALTMLGIIIGVGAVIAMLGVGQGAQKTMQDQIQAMGSNMLFVGSGTVTRGGMHLGWGSTKSLVYNDMLAILRECPAAKAAAPGSSSNAQVVFGNDNWQTRLNGTERSISMFAIGLFRKALHSRRTTSTCRPTSPSLARPFARACLAQPIR